MIEVFEDTTLTDYDLFDAKQKYIYQVFECTLQMDKGKTIICAHESDYNAQWYLRNW